MNKQYTMKTALYDYEAHDTTPSVIIMTFKTRASCIKQAKEAINRKINLYNKHHKPYSRMDYI